MKIAVFMGGSSSERDVSLNTGKAVTKGLATAGHDVTQYDVEWIGKDTLSPAVQAARAEDVDVVFLALHGGLGENGGIQGVLETADLTYTGSGITASAVAMDKDLTKRLFLQHGIPTADWVMIDPETADTAHIIDTLGLPCVVKPADQGSTVGLSLITDMTGLHGAVNQAATYSGSIMAEAFVGGAELTVPVLGGKALPVIEIRPTHELYDYECKYTSGMTEYLVPAPIDNDLATLLQRLALDVFDVLGLRDYARIDFRLDDSGTPLCFEANTLPGMTATSLVPKSAGAAGIKFPDMVSRIAELAYQRKGLR